MAFCVKIESSTNFYFRIVVLIVYLCALNLDIRVNNIPCTPSSQQVWRQEITGWVKVLLSCLDDLVAVLKGLWTKWVFRFSLKMLIVTRTRLENIIWSLNLCWCQMPPGNSPSFWSVWNKKLFHKCQHFPPSLLPRFCSGGEKARNFFSYNSRLNSHKKKSTKIVT